MAREEKSPFMDQRRERVAPYFSIKAVPLFSCEREASVGVPRGEYGAKPTPSQVKLIAIAYGSEGERGVRLLLWNKGEEGPVDIRAENGAAALDVHAAERVVVLHAEDALSPVPAVGVDRAIREMIYTSDMIRVHMREQHRQGLLRHALRDLPYIS